MKSPLFLFLLGILVYLICYMLGREGRNQVWVALRPHIMPFALIAIAVAVLSSFALSGGVFRIT